MLSDPVSIAVISMVSGLGIAYITNVAAKKVQVTKAKKQPKDRMEQMFDGYERLIRAKDTEAERLMRNIVSLETNVAQLQAQLEDMTELLDKTKNELKGERDESDKLRQDLLRFKEEYQSQKK